ncbi:MAG: hydroxyectoine utilization dehydratase EutB [Anaerolineales bacterium]|nr:hydroxyectoine utilization dehydratase EutB [Anaerolineales bacterium]
MPSSPLVTLRDIYLAQSRIEPLVRRTPYAFSEILSERVGSQVGFKLENLQITGSFKIRGAANKLLSLSDEERAAGVVVVSSGNHGRAVAYVAGRLGIRATICVSSRVPLHKVDAIRTLGAEVEIVGERQEDAEVRAADLVKNRGLTYVNPFDDLEVIAGQGTVGLEILRQSPKVKSVIVPLSGGGLISGIALVMNSTDPAISVIGVTMERGPAMYLSLDAGTPVTVDEQETLADALIGGIGIENQYTLEICNRFVDDVILVSEEEIADAMMFAYSEHRLILEGAGAVGIAALLAGKAEAREETTVVLSGGNVELGRFKAVMEGCC